MKLTFVAAGAAGLFIAATAFAADVPTARVAYGDLNLATPAGVERLHSRLRGAAESVCEHGAFRDLAALSAEHACIERSVGDALAQVQATTSVRIAKL